MCPLLRGPGPALETDGDPTADPASAERPHPHHDHEPKARTRRVALLTPGWLAWLDRVRVRQPSGPAGPGSAALDALD